MPDVDTRQPALNQRGRRLNAAQPPANVVQLDTAARRMARSARREAVDLPEVHGLADLVSFSDDERLEELMCRCLREPDGAS